MEKSQILILFEGGASKPTNIRWIFDARPPERILIPKFLLNSIKNCYSGNPGNCAQIHISRVGDFIPEISILSELTFLTENKRE
jgi:hypothetical protein